MKVISISLTFFNIYVALNTVPSTALRGDPRELRPKSIKAEIGTDASTSNSNEPVIVHADDSKHPRSVPKNAPSNANNEAYAALINEQDVVEFNLFASEEASGQTYRAKGAELLTRDGVDSVLIKPEEMEDCDPGMAKTGADSSTCKEVLDTTMEGGGISVESKIGNEDGSPKEEQYGEELYIQELHSLTRADDDNETVFFEDFDLDVEDDGRSDRRLNINTGGIGIFKPLQCNSAGLPSAASCEASPHGLLSAIVAAAGSGKTVIPCGKCIKYDLPKNTVTTIRGGLDIHGKLYIPPNYKSTLKTPFVFVQGELQMSDTNPISPDNESIKIILTGTTDVTFTPADSNANLPGTPFNAGSKPFLVAGGKLDIRGWDIADGNKRVATWAPLLSMVEGAKPEPALSAPMLIKYPIQPAGTTRTCPRQIINHDFTGSVDHSLWAGGEGTIISHDAVNGTMVLTNIKKSWQGFRLDFTRLIIDCPLKQDTDYLITARIKIDKPGMDGKDMPCKTGTNEWNDCPRMTRKIMRGVNNDIYNSQRLNKGTIGKYGEWFTLAQVWKFNSEHISNDVIGSIFALENNEPGTTVTLDSFVFELPSSKSYPVSNNVCSELVVNGNAESTDGNGLAFYPMYSSRSDSWEPTITKETLSNGKVNKFYRAGNRRWHSDSIRFNLANGCFVKAMTYWISLRVRVSSISPIPYYVQINGQRPDSGWTRKQPLRCPAQSKADGWVTCSGPYVIENDLSTSSITGDLNFEVIFDWQLDVGPVWSTVDYDDISISFMAGPAEGLRMDSKILPKWGPKADVHITSSTISNRDSQNAVIESVTADANGYATVKLKTGIETVLSELKAPGTGVEVLLLSRNIKIQGEANGTALQGGYFQVFHTPGVAQIIEGVELSNMGQQKGKNRFALQFLFSGDVPGTSIARNSIRNSNHRCIVVEGSSNITIEANVAHDTAGHCYYIGSDARDNTLLSNIGSRTNDVINWGKHVNGETDYDRATFQLYNPRNDYIGNVAAGSDGRGFGIYNDWRTLGEDYVDTKKGSIRRLEMKTFRDNKAHSNTWQGFSFYDFEQFLELRDYERVPIFHNVQSYRNREHGIYSRNLVAARFIGGMVSDNQWGFVLSYSDGVTIDAMTVRGYTDTLKYITTPANREKLCSRSYWTHEGLQMMTRKDRNGELDPNRGVRLRNMVFSDFDKYSCPLGSWPISFNDGRTDSHFDYTSSMENVTFVESRGLLIDGCKASSSYGVDDIVITDIDGSFIKSIDTSLENETGTLISNKLQTFGDCIEYAGNCMSYCPGVCLRTVKYEVEQFGTENYKLEVTNSNGDSIQVSSKIQPGDYNFYSRLWTTRKFSVSLPSGSYTARFVDKDGIHVWPTFVEETWEATPDCQMSSAPFDITLSEPHADFDCDELIRNGGQDDATLTTAEPWVHTDPGVQVGVGLGRNSSDAIITINRGGTWTGLGQSIDSRCGNKLRGGYVDFTAWIKLTNNDGSPATNINPDTDWWTRTSPQLVLNYKEYRDESTKDYIYNRETNDVARLSRPYKSDQFNLIHGIFRLPSTFHLTIEIDSAPSNIQLRIDDVSMRPFQCNRDSLVKNGDLEDSNVTKYWSSWGSLKLDITTGYGGQGNAIRASQRSHYSHGPAQQINMDCDLEVGDRILFQSRIKFESGGSQTTCNVYTWDSSTRCSDILFYSDKHGTRQYMRVAQIVTDNPDKNGWYHAHGVLVLNDNHIDADYTKIYFDGTATSRDVLVDNLEAKVAPRECNALVLNPSFQDAAAFWSYIDRGQSKLELVQGASGGSKDFALRSFSRDNTWRGVRQQLDTRCFVEGMEYEITGKFRLLNATTAQGVMCDTNVQTNNRQNTQCPSVVIYGWGCNGGDVYWRFFNTIPLFVWNPNSFNDFRVGFAVDDRLASCGTVHVYIHQINKDWDIVMDDVQISTVSTQEPSSTPTFAPSEFVPDVTDTPTSRPTSMPTVATITDCPDEDAGSVPISAGPVMLSKSETLCILTKAVEDTDGSLSNIAPVARSYDGRAWEPSAGGFATHLLQNIAFGDYSSGTQINLPDLAAGEKYFLTSYSYTASHKEKLARLLETATFGTTSAGLAEWNKGAVTIDTVSEWIKEQINFPMTSHREFFRRRVNPRFPNPRSIGRSDHPCDSLSRWRAFAFSRKDGDLWWFHQIFSTVFKAGDKYVTIKLNGHVRTVVIPGSIVFANSKYILEYNREYQMCQLPEERSKGRVYLRMNDNSCQWFENPLISFYPPDSINPPLVLNLPNISQSVLEPIDEAMTNGEEFIFFDGIDDPSCDQLNDVTEQNDSPVFGRLPDGSWLQYDPRLKLENNTVDDPIADGGGLVQALTGQKTRCSNAPRTFLNEESCVLSYSTSACGSLGSPQLKIKLSEETLKTLHDMTGQYVYGVLGLPVVDFQGTKLASPCQPGLRSRWEIKSAAKCPSPTVLEAATNATLVNLLTKSNDKNPYIRDIYFPNSGYSCGSANTAALANVEIVIGATCFKRVHPEHFSVYDFTYWTLEDTHPGNMVAMMEGEPNPIKKWMDIDSKVFLTYPAFPDNDVPNHPIERWDIHSVHFSKLGRFGDEVNFVDLPNELRTAEVAEHFGESVSTRGSGIVVCGSPNEVANDPTLGYQFDVTTGADTIWGLERQREHVWTMIGLQADDQLRQRVAWALSQLLVVVPAAVEIAGSHTEPFLSYYDIFVRNAFGNYGDILREISYSPLMAENLSFLQSKSAAYMWEAQSKVSFADENFAREIMQLFSTGLYLLNIDGTPKLDKNKQPIAVYSNDEIMSFARIWTGFDYQQGRGNVEESSWSGNRHDPMRIQASWRDKFPKSDLVGGYIGDGYPLCVDLPPKMFLRKGASYRLLGASFMPELMEDDSNLKTDPTVKKFALEASSQLKAKLCNQDSSGTCQYANAVTLDTKLDCTGKECNADTLRVVEVTPGIHYEYVRPACVEQAFYNNAKKVINKQRWDDSSCANPLLPYAAEACCSMGQLTAYRSPDYLFDQERVLFSTANERCEKMGKMSCDFNDIGGLAWHKKGYHWSTDSCLIKVKVNAIGQVALVYEPDDYAFLHPHIDSANRNFFKVYWDGEYPLNNKDLPEDNSCGNGICETLATGECLCGTSISEARVFNSMPGSVEEVLSLTIGAFDPSAYDEGTFAEVLNANGVTAHLTSPGVFNTDTVFVVTDSFGRVRRFKNSREHVKIQGAPHFSFRNAPSFMSVLNAESSVRDAMYETDAALDHYLYHDNTAPFVAHRLIQRFTTSNPNPNYVKAVATAFQQGKYGTFGTGKYGDMEATIAAVLLEPEARSTALNADPFVGGVNEPLLRVMALMRSMELQQAEGEPITRLHDMDVKIGMMAHSFPTVFSFYLPEYEPNGRAGVASLVSPEAQIMDMPKTIGLLNGMFSLIKYGLSNCYGGFGSNWKSCTEGNFVGAPAFLSFSRPFDGIDSIEGHAAEVVGELSVLLTSGRLSAASRSVIETAYIEKLSDPSGGADAAMRLAQQLIVATPEFQTTNTVKLNGQVRNLPEPPQPSGTPYKAIVYVMFGGGCDSYNMLVPHTCTGSKDMYAEYAQVREEVALKKTDLRVLNGTTDNQICETFGVHPKLQAVQEMYNDGDLLFFTNTGVLTKETDKYNYQRDTVTQLFAHNWMQREAQRVDPLKEEDGTGVLGRIADALTLKGLNVGAFAIDVNAISLVGRPGVSSTPFILSGGGVTNFNYNPSTNSMNSIITSLNEATAHDSGIFGELWSSKLIKSIADNQNIYNTLAGKVTETTFPNSGLGRQLQMVAKMIDSREARGSDADVFFLSTGGWDTHSDVLDRQNELFADVDASFKAFSDEMKAKGTWDSATVIQTSDFARTLNPNTGRGSDHGWGGNYMMFGGGVKGRQIIGSYPDNLTDEGELSVGRGRMIPTTSWDAVFLPIAEWAGVNGADLDEICPNKDSFPASHFTHVANLFEMN